VQEAVEEMDRDSKDNLATLPGVKHEPYCIHMWLILHFLTLSVRECIGEPDQCGLFYKIAMHTQCWNPVPFGWL